MLRIRIVAALAIIAPVLGVFWADYAWGPPGAWMFPLGLLVALAATDEVLALVQQNDLKPLRWAVFAGVFSVYSAAGGPMAWGWFGYEYPPDCPLGRLGWPLAGMALAVGLVAMGEIRRFREPGSSIANTSAGVFVIAYIGLLTAFLPPLRTFHGDNRLGLLALVSMIFVVKMSDVGAYLTGRFLGRTKLAPLVSPGKTIEGLVGGVAVGCLAAWFFFAVLGPWWVGGVSPGSVGRWLGYGVAVSLAGVAGDLFESLLKRDAQKKDSSGWLPGLGGVMDVLDSILTAAPAAMVYWSAFLTE